MKDIPVSVCNVTHGSKPSYLGLYFAPIVLNVDPEDFDSFNIGDTWVIEGTPYCCKIVKKKRYTETALIKVGLITSNPVDYVESITHLSLLSSNLRTKIKTSSEKDFEYIEISDNNLNNEESLLDDEMLSILNNLTIVYYDKDKMMLYDNYKKLFSYKEPIKR